MRISDWSSDVCSSDLEVLDTDRSDRVAGLDPEFDKFPYVNGALFKGHLRTAVFDAQMRDDLIAATKFDWGKVSPAIFGSLFQSVMDKDERRRKGAHYTNEPTIMKVNGPLFLAEFRRSEEHTSELQSLMRISYAVFCLKKKKTDK